MRPSRLLVGLAAALALLLAGVLTVSAVALYRAGREPGPRAADELAAREELTHALARADARLAAVRDELASTAALLREREARLTSLAGRVAEVERESRAGERLLHAYAGGVALIQATLRYEDRAGRPLRHRGAERRPWRGALGPSPVGVDGNGPIVTATLVGTGFLVDARGTVLTSRHVVRPWESEDELEALRELAVEPRLAQLRAFFPGLSDPVPLRDGRASETADLVRLTATLPPGAVPVLPLDEGVAAPGRPVIVLGYPAGLELLLARVDPAVLRSLIPDDVEDITDDTVDVPRLLTELARRRLIRPYASWGHVVDTRAHLLTYDARTAVGASGGPVLSVAGRVIAVNQAVLRDFDAAAFGVPIRHGLGLLRGRPVSR
jgi:S1-C subfamily serine protease